MRVSRVDVKRARVKKTKWDRTQKKRWSRRKRRRRENGQEIWFWTLLKVLKAIKEETQNLKKLLFGRCTGKGSGRKPNMVSDSSVYGLRLTVRKADGDQWASDRVKSEVTLSVLVACERAARYTRKTWPDFILLSRAVVTSPSRRPSRGPPHTHARTQTHAHLCSC